MTSILILKITNMKKMHKGKKSKTRSREDLIDGLPVLRGMFVCPESLIDNIIPPVSELVLSDLKSDEQDISLREEKKRNGITWAV
jgi:hypothetical protein